MFRLPAARIQAVTALAGSASPWQASAGEVQDTEVVHTVAPAATLRVVLMPSDVLDRAANATADMIAELRLAVSGTDVASIGWSLGEHSFSKAQVAQLHSILRRAAGDANEQGGTPVVLAGAGQAPIASASGTSASAALWAGLMALADQCAHHGLGFVNPAIYRIARGARYHKAFHDITTGNNLNHKLHHGELPRRSRMGPGDGLWGSPKRAGAHPPAGPQPRIA